MTVCSKKASYASVICMSNLSLGQDGDVCVYELSKYGKVANSCKMLINQLAKAELGKTISL